MSTISFKRPKDFLADRNKTFHGKTSFNAEEQKCFEIDGYACHYCGTTEALTIDHIVPRSLGGTNTLSNYLTACHSCNASKRNKPYEDFIEWREAEMAAFVTMYTMADCL